MRHILCEAEIKLDEIMEDATGVVNGLTPKQRNDLSECIEVKFHYVLERIFCEANSLENYQSLLNYILYMIRCAGDDSTTCKFLVLLLDNGEGITTLMRYLACDPSLQKRQFSLQSTMYMLDRIACKTEDGLLLKMLHYVNNSDVEKFDDIYRARVEWDFVNIVVPPFFCCAANAAYAGFQQISEL